MPTKVWAPGESVISTDFNRMVQEQVIPTFANAADRDSFMPAPKVGQYCYLATPGVLLQYTDKSVVPGWYRPWDQPWGCIQPTTVIVPDSAISWGQLFTNGYAACPTPRRMVRIHYEMWIQKGVDGNDAHCYVRMLNARDGSMLMDRLVTLHQGWTATISLTSVNDSTDVTGTHLQGFCTWGWYYTAWIRLVIEDVGPAPLIHVGT